MSTASTNPSPDPDVQENLSPDLTRLLRAGIGVLIVDDTADLPDKALLIIKRAAIPVLFLPLFSLQLNT